MKKYCVAAILLLCIALSGAGYIYRWGDKVSIGQYSNDFDNAITKISTDKRVLVIDTSITVTQDVTVSATCTLEIGRDGMLTYANPNVDLTINGPVHAGPYQWIDPNRAWVTFGSGAVTVGHPEWFGGAGDNSTDNHAAIEKAVSSGIPRIELLAGTYLSSSQIDLGSNLILYGAGRDETTIKPTANNTKLLYLAAKSNVKISDLTLDGGSETLTTGGTPANEALIYLYQDCTDITIERVKFNHSLGTTLYSCGGTGHENKNILITGCYFTNGAQNCIHAVYPQSNFRVLNSYFYNATASYAAATNYKGVAFHGVTNGEVAGCTFIQDNGYGCASVIFEWDGTVKSTDCVAHHNYIKGNQYNNLKMDDVHSCSFHHNQCVEAGYDAIYCAGVLNCEVSFNQIYRPDGVGIFVTEGGDTAVHSENVRIIGNIIEDHNYGENSNVSGQQWAIDFRNADKVIISGNTVERDLKNSYGIYCNTVPQYEITNNSFDLLHDIVKSGTYIWTASGSGTNEYYCTLADTNNPSLDDIGSAGGYRGDIYENDILIYEGTAGSLTAGTWDYADNDTLGFSTIYVRLTDGTDPDTKADGYVQHRATTLNNFSEGTNKFKYIANNIGLPMVDYGQVTVPDGSTYYAWWSPLKNANASTASLQATFASDPTDAQKLYFDSTSSRRLVVYVGNDPNANVGISYRVDLTRTFVGYY